MGSTSGRDINKDEASGLTPIAHDKVTIYKEAKMAFIVRSYILMTCILKARPSYNSYHSGCT